MFAWWLEPFPHENQELGATFHYNPLIPAARPLGGLSYTTETKKKEARIQIYNYSNVAKAGS